MAQYDLVIKGGTVATASDTFRADVGISGGRIAALAMNLSSDGAQEIDARGKLVLPGASKPIATSNRNPPPVR